MFFLTIIISIIMTNIRLEYATFVEENENSSHNIERIDNIVKPPKDTRLYRGLKLSNRMKILLISDPSTTISAASMLVEVGSLNDFRDSPGLANLVGHMLIIGSMKYPQMYGFKEFLKDHGGTLDLPVTTEEEQLFSFEVEPNYFAEALDRFAQFFLQPLISFEPQLSVQKSLQVVHSQYLNRAKNDSYRIVEVEKSMSKENHPYNHAFIADVDRFYEPTTNLPVDLEQASLYDKVSKFHSMWYSSNIMNLAIIGRESLDELEMMIRTFKNVKDTDAKKIVYPYNFHPWGEKQLKRKIYIVPIMENEQFLRLIFPVPDFRHTGTLPDIYLRYFMKYKGANGLSSVLRKKGFCKAVDSSYSSSAGIAFFDIVCDLTSAGLRQVDDVINLIFQYIHILKSNGAQEWMLMEIKKLHETAFLTWTPSEEEEISSVQNFALLMPGNKGGLDENLNM